MINHIRNNNGRKKNHLKLFFIYRTFTHSKTTKLFRKYHKKTLVLPVWTILVLSWLAIQNSKGARQEIWSTPTNISYYSLEVRHYIMLHIYNGSIPKVCIPIRSNVQSLKMCHQHFCTFGNIIRTLDNLLSNKLWIDSVRRREMGTTLTLQPGGAAHQLPQCSLHPSRAPTLCVTTQPNIIFKHNQRNSYSI